MILTEGNYYSPESNMSYMSASQYKDFEKCEAAAMAKLTGEYQTEVTPAMRLGSFVDAHFSGTLPHFKADSENRDMFLKDGVTLKAEFRRAEGTTQNEGIIPRLERDRLYMLLMSGKKQVILTGEIAGVSFKCKIDSLLDASQVEQIAREFPETADLFTFSDGAIVDQKIMRSLDDVWKEDAAEKQPFALAWGYDIQGAIYKAVEGNDLPFILAIGTKQDPPDLKALYIPDDMLFDALAKVEVNAPRFQKIKMGLEAPARCEKCAYCRMTRKLTNIEPVVWPLR